MAMSEHSLECRQVQSGTHEVDRRQVTEIVDPQLGTPDGVGRCLLESPAVGPAKKSVSTRGALENEIQLIGWTRKPAAV